MNNLKALVASDAPTSEIDSQLTNLSNRLGYLADLVESLEHRLTPVLSPVLSGENSDSKASPREVLSPVAERVRTSTDQVDSLHSRVQSLLSSLAI